MTNGTLTAKDALDLGLAAKVVADDCRRDRIVVNRDVRFVRRRHRTSAMDQSLDHGGSDGAPGTSAARASSL